MTKKPCEFRMWLAAIILVAAGAAHGQVTFTADSGSPYPAGASPYSVAVADFDDDGFPDLAIANRNTNTVTILRNNGAAGGFTPFPKSPFAVGSRPVAIAAGNFACSKPAAMGVAVTNELDNTVTVLMGDGKGDFTPVTLAVGTNPDAIAVGNFNGNGACDLAVANNGSNNVSILSNTGSGAFMPQTVVTLPLLNPDGTAATSLHPVAIAIGDFNRDGIPDLAVVNATNGSLWIMLGQAMLKFAPPPIPTPAPNPMQTIATPFPVPPLLSMNGYGGGTPVALATADFNGDQIPDLVVVNQTTNNISTLLGDGTGNLAPATSAAASLTSVGTAPVSVAVADFNLDGIPDIVVANSGSNTVSVLLNTTSPGGPSDLMVTFASAITVAVGATPMWVAAADVNQDGAPDIVVANEGGNTVSVLLNGSSAVNIPTMVSTASGLPSIASGSMVSIYGTNLASTAATATTPTPPLSLGGVSVAITDANQNTQFIPLFYVSPTLINAQIPETVATGGAKFTILAPSVTKTAPISIGSVAPALFTANENGSGVAMGEFLTMMPDGFYTLTNVYQCTGGPGTCIAVPLNVASAIASGFEPELILYGTGFRNAMSSMVSATIVPQFGSTASQTIVASMVGAVSPTGIGPDMAMFALTTPLSGPVTVSLSVMQGSGVQVTSNIVTLFF